MRFRNIPSWNLGNLGFVFSGIWGFRGEVRMQTGFIILGLGLGSV